MYRELYEKDAPSDESKIVAELIERAIVLASAEVDMTVQYMIEGLLAVIHLKPPHQAQWNIMWHHDKSAHIETGFTDPAIADPKIQELLTEDISKIFIHLHAFCPCPSCKGS